MRCCTKQEHYKSVGGFLWSYSEDKPDDYIRLGNGLKQKVQCVETGEVYGSIREAVRMKYGGNENCRRHIQESIKYGWKVKGYSWKLLNQDNPVPRRSDTQGATTN